MPVVEETINRFYDVTMFSPEATELRGDTLLSNLGYRTDPATPHPEASLALVRRLLESAPDHAERVLDVACGIGGTTRLLVSRYGEGKVTAINISEKQLDHCRQVVPDATFLRMSATELEFAEGTFDLVFCVEAAFHFLTKQRFLAEAFRVLRPGGRLVLSDVLFRRLAQFLTRRKHPQENYVADLQAYKAQFLAAGFTRVEIEDATEAVWVNYCEHLSLLRHKSKEDLKGVGRAVQRLTMLPRRAVIYAPIVCAEKPL